ncbi:nuclear transport factor 2 family protein [Nocardia wallacei]|uniref:nuclear transport factor 2 family protein n=1 Tax=Nocardia wallacei TaxID=480035 RepID=UPI002457BF8C|nr:nuclear transport factor 2 family protein [Nocardia wallacei]
MLTAEDKWAIGETISLHGHLFDEGQLDRLGELFTSDVVYDVSDMDYGVLVGIDAIRDAGLALGARNPLAHIVTNIVITDTEDDDTATVRSKGLAVMSDRSCGTVTYVDTVRRQSDGWRISHRKMLARREPLGGARA